MNLHPSGGRAAPHWPSALRADASSAAPSAARAGVVTRVDLAGRGTMTVRRVGLRGSPVVLLHGWGATADLNFNSVYSTLGQRWRVVAPDHRGHGGGIRSEKPFSLIDCADDVAHLIRHLNLAPVTALGYSMGGPIAMLLADRHPELVTGLVLCATASHFGNNRLRRAALSGLGAAGLLCRSLPESIRTIGHHIPDVTNIVQAGGELAAFEATRWLDRLRLPTAVVVTANDHLVPPSDQAMLAAGIPGASTIVCEGDHDVCFRHPRRFSVAIEEAVATVTQPDDPARMATRAA